MKNITYTITLLMFAVGVFAEIFAAGTPAGTVIHSRSRATYTTVSGSQSDTAYSAFVSITVKQVGSFNITPAINAMNSMSDSTFVDFPAVIINSGNGTDLGRITVNSSKGWLTQLFSDANGDGVLQPAEVAAGTITQTSSLSADNDYKLIVRVKVPRDESLNGQKDTTTVTVKSNFDSTKIISGKCITTVQSASFTIALNGLTVNNPTPNAGTNIIYTLTVTNSGSLSANSVFVQNLIPVGLTYVSNTTSQGTVNSSGNPIVWNLGTIPSNTTVTLTITLNVGSSVLPGTIINNDMLKRYTVGTNSYAVGSNIVPITVGGVLTYGVQLIPFTTSVTKEATDTAVYRMSVRNSGSFNDVIELNFSSTRNLSWSFYKDANNNLLLDPTDPLLVNTNGAEGIDVDTLSAGDSVRVFARTIVPRFQSASLKDSLLINAFSSGDNGKSSTSMLFTTILSPIVSMTKDVFPVGDQPAGSVMTYIMTYSNTGNITVNNFSVIDVTPQSTNYIPNSVKLNNVTVNDNTGPVTVTEDAFNNKVITVNIGSLNAQASGTVEFKVKIK